MERFPWYDAWWLERYVRAKNYIARRDPAGLSAFRAAFDPLRTRTDFATRMLDDFFSEEQFEQVGAAFRAIRPDRLEMHELPRHGRFVVHDHPMLIALHAAIAPAVGRLVGEEVEPAYSFIALYNRNGICPVHLDAPVSKWTLDLCVSQSAPWPISFSEVVPWPEDFPANFDRWEESILHAPEHSFRSVTMKPGQAVLFSGSSQWHYRERFLEAGPQGHCDLLFLHFKPAGTGRISDWEAWEAMFCCPGLTDAIR